MKGLTFALLLIFSYAVESAQVRIKDLTDFEGIRSNQLVGYGLVVGLNGTGDKLNSSPFTGQALRDILSSMGISTNLEKINTKNIAGVIVTANLPPFARPGSTIDLNVSTIGDASSLLGGTLLPTTLIGSDGKVYAVAQGNMVVGGFSARGKTAQVVRNVPTVGRIPEGGTVERSSPSSFTELSKMRILLKRPDLTNAKKVSKAINKELKADITYPLDPGTVLLSIPPDAQVVELLSKIEQTLVVTDKLARVVINERSGVIVMGSNVRIDTVAIAQGNLTIQIDEKEYTSQPLPFSNTGKTTVMDRTHLKVDDKGTQLAVITAGVTLQQLIKGLNALGVTPYDMISILQSIKAAGALYADIEII